MVIFFQSIYGNAKENNDGSNTSEKNGLPMAYNLLVKEYQVFDREVFNKTTFSNNNIGVFNIDYDAQLPAIPGSSSIIWTQSGTTINLEKTGNIGIGTMSPDSKLTVKGKIHTEELKVDLNVAGPDYVFEKDYQLIPLEQLEDYIKRNNHLPDVPAAKELEQSGIKLSEMCMILLKKTEELTLYIIDHEKRISKLE
jgi:hypothetical protein